MCLTRSGEVSSVHVQPCAFPACASKTQTKVWCLWSTSLLILARGYTQGSFSHLTPFLLLPAHRCGILNPPGVCMLMERVPSDGVAAVRTSSCHNSTVLFKCISHPSPKVGVAFMRKWARANPGAFSIPPACGLQGSICFSNRQSSQHTSISQNPLRTQEGITRVCQGLAP